MPDPRCPICKKLPGNGPRSSFFPFCGQRCKSVDLGNWLGNRYVVDAGLPGDESVPASDESVPASTEEDRVGNE